MRSGETPVVLMGKLFLCLWAVVACAQELHWDKSMAAAGKARQEGRYSEAERLFIDAIKELEEFGPGDPRLPASLSSLAELYRTSSKYTKAEALYKRGVEVGGKALGATPPGGARDPENLGVFHPRGAKVGGGGAAQKASTGDRGKSGGEGNPGGSRHS